MYNKPTFKVKLTNKELSAIAELDPNADYDDVVIMGSCDSSFSAECSYEGDGNYNVSLKLLDTDEVFNFKYNVIFNYLDDSEGKHLDDSIASIFAQMLYRLCYIIQTAQAKAKMSDLFKECMDATSVSMLCDISHRYEPCSSYIMKRMCA